jgi:hypothetical protein
MGLNLVRHSGKLAINLLSYGTVILQMINTETRK